MTTELGSPDDHHRPIPEGSGAMACLGFSWAEIVELLGERIAKAAPDVVRKTNTIWSIHAHNNGIRIEFYEDEDAHRRKLLKQVASPGPQVHAGRILG